MVGPAGPQSAAPLAIISMTLLSLYTDPVTSGGCRIFPTWLDSEITKYVFLPQVFSGSQLSVGTQEAESITEKTKLGRNVRETETSCPKGLYLGGKFCCQPCQPGRSHGASRDEWENQGEGLRCPRGKNVLNS